MQYTQILTCNEILGTCCNDYGLVMLFDIVRRVFDIMQIIVPIILIAMTIVQMTKMVANPETKNGMKKVVNNVIAAVIIFFLPVVVDTVMAILPTSESFQVATCWDQAKSYAATARQGSSYVDTEEDSDRKTILIDPTKYDPGTTSTGSSSTSNYSGDGAVSNGEASATGQAIVNYAARFIGNRYCWGGKDPNTCADCSGFVAYVFKHFGISLYPQTGVMWSQSEKYNLVSPSDIRAGDVIMYDGHVGILTGNGPEIIHAKGTKWGIVRDPDYRKCSSHAIKGIMRINGVN